MNLAHELILGLQWHPCHSQPHTHVDLAIVAPKLRTFAPKWGLAKQKNLLPRSPVVCGTCPAAWVGVDSSAQNTLSPPTMVPAGYLWSRTTPHDPPKGTHSHGTFISKLRPMAAPVKKVRFPPNISDRNRPWGSPGAMHTRPRPCGYSAGILYSRQGGLESTAEPATYAHQSSSRDLHVICTSLKNEQITQILMCMPAPPAHAPHSGGGTTLACPSLIHE